MGDFGANFRRPETGIQTVEGNVAGPRAAMLSKKRQQEQDEFEQRTKQIRLDRIRESKGMDDKFQNNTIQSSEELAFKAATVGLVTAQEFAEATMGNNKHSASKLKDELSEEHLKQQKLKDLEEKKRRKAEKKKKKQRQMQRCALSFAGGDDDEEEEEEGGPVSVNGLTNEKPSKANKSSNMRKDPTVDTSFLPDRAREEAMEQEKQRLKQEWITQQQLIKQAALEIIYSYWDGSGHRRTVRVKKGDTIGDFLETVRLDLSKDFREMQSISGGDALLYVKEDLILPQDVTFYDLIVTKARGKSGPLFHFDVHDDVRVGAVDVRVEKDESHPGKVVERRWYDKNKHIFPASRWEVFDPTKDYGRYTIHGGEVTKKK
jgi:protein FAM50